MKKNLTILLVIIMSLTFMLIGVACNNSTKLKSPTSLKITSDVLSWDEVKNATAYGVSIDSKDDIITAETNFAIVGLTKGEHKIKVRSLILNDKKEITSQSDYTSEISFTKSDNLDIVTNLKVEGRTVTWDAVTGNNGYGVIVGGNAETVVTDTKYEIKEEETPNYAVYEIKVRAKGNGKESLDSYPLVTKFTKSTTLSTPDKFTLKDDKMSWSAVTNAKRYFLSATKQISEGEEKVVYTYETTNTNTSISNFKIKTAGIYDVTIYAVGDGAVYKHSEKSPLVDDKNQQASIIKLASPTNLRLELVETSNDSVKESVVKWDGVSNAKSYKLTFKSNDYSTTKSDISNTDSEFNLSTFDTLKSSSNAGKIFDIYIEAIGEKNTISSDMIKFGTVENEIYYQSYSTPELLNNIYQITNMGHLPFMIQMPNVAFELKNDIDLKNAEWKPIGKCNGANHTNCQSFNGTLSGNGFKISNFTISKAYDTNAIGLFTCLGADAKVENIAFLGVNITSNKNVSAGVVAGINRGIIKDVVIEGSIKVSSVVGGVAGYNEGEILSVSADVKIEGVSAGGIAGVNRGKIVGCSTNQNIHSVEISKESGNSDINFCGGIVGMNETGAEIYYSYSTSTVSMEISIKNAKFYIGGVVGINKGTITNTYSAKYKGKSTAQSITARSSATNATGYAGGFVGQNSGTIQDCYVVSDKVISDQYAGGFVGRNLQGGFIKNSYSINEVKAKNKGAFAYENNGDVTNSYFRTNNNPGLSASNDGDIVGVLGKDISNMKTIAQDLGNSFFYDNTVLTEAPILGDLLYITSNYRGAQVRKESKPSYEIKAFLKGEPQAPTTALNSKTTGMSFEKYSITRVINNEEYTIQTVRLVIIN